MAGENYEIEFGGQYIKVPAWASQESIDNLASLSKDNISKLKKLVDIETGTLRAVNEMLKAQERLRSDVTKDNEKLIKELLASQKAIEDAVDKNTQETKKSKDEENNKEKKLREEREQAEKDLINTMKRGLDGIRKSTKDAVGSISKGDFEGLATAIGGVVGLGAAAGFAAGAMLNFAKSLSELSNVGAGFGMSLQEIRQIAASAGTGLDGLAKIAQSNGMSFRALGSSSNEGLREFARLSREARGLAFTDEEVQDRAREMGINVSSVLQEAASSGKSFGDAMTDLRDQTYGLTGDIRHLGRSLTMFGMSNEEANQLLAEEIELRRLSGQSEQQIQAEAADSMREFVSETTKLSNITGANRREVQRAGIEAATNDAILRDFKNQFSGEFAAITGTLAGGPGEDIGIALAKAISDPEGMDVTTILQQSNDELYMAISRIPGALERLQDLQNFGRQNIGSMDTETYNANIASGIARLGDGLNETDRRQFARQARLGDDNAGLAVAFTDSLNGITRNVEDIKTANAELAAANKDAEASAIDTKARMDSLTNQIKASMTTDLLEGLNIDMEGNGEDLVQALSSMENQFLELGFLGAIKEGISDANWYLKGILAALAVGALSGPIGGLIRGVGAFTRVGGRFLTTAGSVLRNAPGAALSGVRTTARVVTSTGIAARNAPGVVASAVRNAPGAVVAGAGAAATALKNVPGAITDAVRSGIDDAASSAAKASGEVAEAGAKAAAGAVDDVAGTAARTVASEVAEEGSEAVARRISARVAETTATSLGKSFVKKIPLIGLAAGIGMGGWRAMQGDFVGAGGEVASGVVGTLPGAGTAASIAIDAALLARDIAKIYEDEGFSSEDAARFSSMDASEQLLNDMTDRITRAEAGENVYWGRDSVGIAEDQSNMQDLLVSEITRLTDIMEQTGELSQREADALARYNDMLSNMDQPTGMEILDQVGVDSGIIAQMNETDQDAVILMANKVDTLAEKLADGNLSETDRGKVMKEYASAINDLKTIEENGITAEAKQQAQRAKDRDVDVQGLLVEKAMIEGLAARLEEEIPDESKARLNEIDKIISGLDEVARGDLSLPGDAILKMRESTANKLQADKDKLAALEEEYGKATQIGINEKQAKALLSSGIADNEEQANEMAAIYGYEDEEANKKYQETSKAVRESEDQLKRIENDRRYKKARANELAREMGISTEKITQSEDGKTTKYTNQDGYEIKDGGLYVNGQRVPDELLNQTERDRFKAQETQYNAFNRVPTSKAPDANEPPDTDKNDRISEKVIVPGGQKELETLLNETNRLLRKQTDILEQQ